MLWLGAVDDGSISFFVASAFWGPARFMVLMVGVCAMRSLIDEVFNLTTPLLHVLFM